ncbi:MAG TPA: T9SS type A sorting domain-containing protein [Bacteroidia bacterium]|nr:T9SS type A sorting domain-containing protein [Bacteroidia bacterium]HNU32041.1 T9SS type A sorting domain-containing protein [Bacteroidia bacterium]
MRILFSLQNRLILLFLIISISKSVIGQQPFITTLKTNNGHLFYVKSLSESNGQIISLTMDSWFPCEQQLRIFDLQGNLIATKNFRIFDSLMATTCTGTSGFCNGVKFYKTDVHFSQVDSTYKILASFYENYGNCPQSFGVTLVSLDLNLNIIWHKVYDSFAGYVKIIDDTTAFFGYGNHLTKLNLSTGNILWTKSLLFGSINGLTSGFNDSTFYICSGPPAGIAQIDYLGNVLMQKYFSDSLSIQTDKEAFNIIKTPDNGLAVLCSRYDNNTHSYFCLTKLDYQGNYLWEKNYFNPSKRFLISFTSNAFVATLTDSGFFIPFEILDTIVPSNQKTISLLKLQNDGTVMWNRYFDGTNFACINISSLNYIKPSSLGSYLIAGSSLMNLDSTGGGCFFQPYDTIIQTNFSYPSLATLPTGTSYNLAQLYNYSFEALGNSEVVFVESCNSVSNDNNLFQQNRITVFPNPTDNQILVKCYFLKSDRIFLKDALGKIVFDKIISHPFKDLIIETYSIPNGIYFLQIISDKKTFSQKIVVQH